MNNPVLVPLITKTRPASVKATCHGDGGGAGAGADAPVVALVGAPNVGKSTLFNALTGARVTMGNWPGTTVAVSRGVWRTQVERTGAKTCGCDSCDCAASEGSQRRDFTLVDLPGAYSLDPMSPDEALTRDLLVDGPADERPDVTVVVADAAHLTRSLYIVSQLRERAMRVVVVVTMHDVARHRGIEVDSFALAERLGCPVALLDPRRRRGVDQLATVVLEALDAPVPAPREVTLPASDDLDLAREDDRFAFVDAAVTAGTRATGEERRAWSDRIDAIVTRPVLGPLVFLGVMWAVFQITTTVAAPMQDALDALVAGPISSGAQWLFDAAGLGTSPIAGFVVNGLVAGVGMLLTFVPLMTLMFLLLALLEDSGYLARAAVVTDRLMRRIGLPGRAFLPLVVGFGCNVPAIAATRILPGVRQRILTSLLIPFTSCSARLTVFVLLGTTFFGRWAGTVVFAMYLLSILFVLGVGLLLRKTLWRTMGAEPLLLDLPPYQVPTLRLTASVTWVRLKGFLRTASGIIVATVAAVWLLQSIPVNSQYGSFGEVPVEHSVYAASAKAVAPVFAPAGFDQWESVSALVVGFVAKEAVISSWAQTYAVAEPDGAEPGALGVKITQAFDASSGGHPIPAILAFMVFLLAYTPCVATLAAQKREVGWRWTLFGLVMQLAVAWVAAVAVFQIGRLWW